MVARARPLSEPSKDPDFDEERWVAIVRRHAPFLRRSISRLVGAGDHVDDIVQEAFVTAFRRRSDLPDNEGLLRGWLFRAARNHSLHHRRAAARRARKVDDARAAVALVPPTEIDDVQRAAALVRSATLTLPEQLREVFVLVDLEGLTSVDAAAILNLNENTLRARLRKARARFATAVGRLHDAG